MFSTGDGVEENQVRSESITVAMAVIVVQVVSCPTLTDHKLFVIIFQHPENKEIKHSDVLCTSSATLIRG